MSLPLLALALVGHSKDAVHYKHLVACKDDTAIAGAEQHAQVLAALRVGDGHNRADSTHCLTGQQYQQLPSTHIKAAGSVLLDIILFSSSL